MDPMIDDSRSSVNSSSRAVYTRVLPRTSPCIPPAASQLFDRQRIVSTCSGRSQPDHEDVSHDRYRQPRLHLVFRSQCDAFSQHLRGRGRHEEEVPLVAVPPIDRRWPESFRDRARSGGVQDVALRRYATVIGGIRHEVIDGLAALRRIVRCAAHLVVIGPRARGPTISNCSRFHVSDRACVAWRSASS